MTEFSIIIPTWRNLEYLELAYRSVKQNSAAAHEIVVFFNEFDADCEAWLSKHPVRYASAPGNLGVCAAVNQAATLATRDFICFLNDDMYVLPDWDTALAQHIGVDEKLWLSGTAIEAGKAAECYIGGQDYGGSPATFEEDRLLREYAALKRPYNVVSTWTPILLRRHDWEAIGGLDENYFPGNGSDPDLAMNMYRYGCRLFIGVGTSLVYHFSRSTVSRFDGQEPMDPKAYFKEKWGMSWRHFLTRVIRRGAVVTPELMRRTALRSGN